MVLSAKPQYLRGDNMQSILTEDINVVITAKEGGKITAVRKGHNVWTNAGREYSCLLKVKSAATPRAIRQDYIEYVGLGTGTQPETVNVSQVVSPLAHQGNNWLKQINHIRTSFVNPGSRAAVRFVAEFSGSDMINANDEPPFISECGLFTSGNSADPNQPRSIIIVDSGLQVPVAYHTFQPIPMSNTTTIEIVWELRH